MLFRLKVPSGKITEALAILVHEDILQDSAERGLVPEGKSGTSLFGRAAVVKRSEVPALTPDNNSIERKVSLNILLPLGRQHF